MQLASRCLRIEMRKESGYPFRKKVSRTSPELAIEHPKEIAVCCSLLLASSSDASHSFRVRLPYFQCWKMMRRKGRPEGRKEKERRGEEGVSE
ncbi:hypothetical protein NPIL_291061 [Nephila pilipes]|uniref:Uncharacterized protein n=1 Tax=Nephila pilipes TaxID=299642 RepID=A0A8X6T3P3_NEPPI|nr:hypothetical protein NPIL_291061 [Nephila pilipes]